MTLCYRISKRGVLEDYVASKAPECNNVDDYDDNNSNNNSKSSSRNNNNNN
jgi:hypothetical protein